MEVDPDRMEIIDEVITQLIAERERVIKILQACHGPIGATRAELEFFFADMTIKRGSYESR
jgi:hypothetical protein